MIRREFLQTGGAMIVGFSLRDTLVAQEPVVREPKPVRLMRGRSIPGSRSTPTTPQRCI